MLAGVTIVDPATAWIEPDVSSSRTRRSIRSSTSAAARASARAPRSTRTPSRSTPRSAAARRSARSVTFAPGRSSSAGSKAGTFVEIKNSRIGMRTRRAAPLVHRRRRGRRGLEPRRRRDHRQLPAPARQAEEPHDDRQERQDRDPEWLRRPRRGRRRCMDSRRIGYHQGRAAGRARRRPGTPGEQGGVCSPAPGRLSWFSQVSTPCPRWTRRRRDRAQAGALDRAGAAEAADGLLGPVASRPREADHRPARHPARRGRRSRRSRTARPTAATTSRSAAPTSSSSRPAAARSTST